MALIAAPALLYNPPLLDILPMYIAFMLLTPLLMRVAERRGWRLVLAGSGCIWLLAQFNLRGWVYGAAAHFGFPIPLNEMGAFDLFGWQFLWSIGLCLGSIKASAFFSKARISKWVVMLSVIVAVTLFVFRHTDIGALHPVLFDGLVDKWRLAILRLIDAASIGVLLGMFGSPLGGGWLGARLAVLGRNSLEVFCVHVVLCFLFLGLGAGPDMQLAWWQDAMIVIVTIGALFVVAHLVEKHRTSAREQRFKDSRSQVAKDCL
jgi:hypothetical protein